MDSSSGRERRERYGRETREEKLERSDYFSRILETEQTHILGEYSPGSLSPFK
jgi:hypothetical protein